MRALSNDAEIWGCSAGCNVLEWRRNQTWGFILADILSCMRMFPVDDLQTAVSYHFISYHFISAEQYVYAQGHALVRLHANASAQCV